MSIHIGSIIEKVFKDCTMTPEAFAKGLGYVGRDTTYKIFARKTIDTGLLLKISKLLKHDFFQYYINNTDIISDVPATKQDIQNVLKEIKKLSKKK